MWKTALLFFATFLLCQAERPRTTIEESLLKSLLTRYYNNQDRPTDDEGGDGPTIVNANIQVYDYELDTKNEKFTIKTDLTLKWKDPRLAFGRAFAYYAKDLPFTPHWDFIWFPDVYFYNLERGFVHSTPKTNRHLILRRNGEIEAMQKLTLRFYCPHRILNYPIDVVECKMIIKSLAYRSTQLKFGWYDDNVIKSTARLVNGFKAPKLTTEARIDSTSSGSYSYLEATFSFGPRALSPYILALHLPTSLGLLVAWLGFWIDAKQLAARLVLIGLAVMLVAFCGFRCNTLPNQVWANFCLAFLAVQVVIFVALNFAERFQSAKENQARRDVTSPTERGKLLHFLELMSCMIMAVSFVLITCVYWIYFISARGADEKL